MRKSTALMKQSSNAQPVCNMPRNECTEHHVPSQTLHQFAAATQSINSNRVMHFGAFHFITGEQICYDEGFWFSTLSISLILMWHWDKGRGIFSCQTFQENLWLSSAVFIQFSCYGVQQSWAAQLSDMKCKTALLQYYAIRYCLGHY